MPNKNQSRILRYQIMETARQLFQSQGYEYTTLEDITGRLKIKERQILEFFRSKDDLLEAVWSE